MKRGLKMFCKSCGSQIETDSKFCRQCGASQGVSPNAPGAPEIDAPISDPKSAGGRKVGCLAVVGAILLMAILGSRTQNAPSGDNAAAPTLLESADAPAESAETKKADTWSYSTNEDKVRGATSYYARTTSTNSIFQSPPYDAATTMTMVVRKAPSFGTDVILTISSGQLMCPSYEGCSGTVRFDDGPAQEVRFNGPADSSSDTIFVVGAKNFISKLKKANKVIIEKTLYNAGNPQFEFDVKGLEWDH
jgi:hypothetical protein